MADSTVLSIDSNFLLLDTYSVSDENLIANQEITSTFSPETDYIEYYIYGLNNVLLSPYLSEEDRNISIPYNSFSILNGELYINPSLDLETSGFENGSYNVLYNFYSNRLSSSFSTKYFISEISSDRTELRLDSNDIEDADIISSVTDFIEERTADEYYPDFLLNFGSNKTVIANNIALDGNTVLIKLYEPLPQQFGLKSTLWVVEEVAESIAYNITFEEEELKIDDTSIPLKGPNINLDLKDQINNSTEAISLDNLTSSPLTSSYQQLQSLFQEEGLQINVDYTEYSNFILNSSIETRLENFEYKLQLIESYTKSAQSGSNTPNTPSVSGSKVYYTSLIDDIITNFDGYEYFLYFESGSKSWPKSNSEPPYQNLPTTDTTAINWYNEQITSASLYDELNSNSNYYDVPEYLRNDSSNQGYIDFVNMIGQHFDNIWIYLKDVSNKYNADNRINAGVSKDLVAQILRDFSIKIYQNNFSSKDVYTSFLGLTPDGGLFPFPEITSSLPTPTGFEYVDTFISSSTDAVPLDDVNKRIYKRLYHNLPYLLKSKGTTQGLKTLLNIYGIPDTILNISEFGGKDKINENDWDYWYNKFNYAYDTQDNGFISSSWTTNSEWGSSPASETVQFRFKTPGVESATTTYSQSLWSLDTNTHVVLEYTGSGLSSGSYSGAIIDPSNQYAHLKFYPDYVNNPNHSASLYLPFFDGGWWSVMATLTDSTASLYAGNKIYNGNTGTELGFYESDSILSVDSSEWDSGTVSIFASESIYPKFSGSLQEIRYYNTAISESRFKDYVMNPLSFEGNSIESGSLDLTPDQLLFRATLGGELYTGSNSIHPKSDGSWTSVYSFPLSSRFYIENGDFSSNKEYIFLDQPAVGLKNRINDKIKTKSLSLPSYNTTEGAVIPNANTLSNQASIQQDKFRNDQYTNNVDLLEVTFSPQNEINDDIISQLGYFNIGNLIGDPREVSSSNQSYPELDKLRQDYFLKYVHENYDFNDYVRLIKFFDNSLFKQIKDFIPAKTSLASGITIKPTILERQKYPLPQAEWEDLQYSGSVKSFARDYETGSLQVVSGGNGGSMPSLAKGSITRVKIGNGGTDFDPAGNYTVTVSGGGGTGAEISINSIDVDSYTLSAGTQLLNATAQQPSYTPGTYSNVLCSLSGGGNVRLTIIVNALTQISSVIVDSDVTGLSIGDTITIDKNDIGGSGISGNATVTLTAPYLNPVGGNISSISIVNGGLGYTSFPTLTVNGSPGTGANLQVTELGGSQVVQNWSGHNITPSGSVAFTQDDAREFINGELSGSTILVEDGELNPNNPVKLPDTTIVEYGVSGSNNINPGIGEIFWQEADQIITQGAFTFTNKVIGSLYINETTLNDDSISIALKNLQIGDIMEFTARIGLLNTIFFPPTVSFSNRKVTQKINNITRNSLGIWYIEFDIKTATVIKGYNDPKILGYASGSSEVLFTPFINTPNFTYSDYNAVLGNATDIRPGTIYQDIDYSSDSITPVNFGQILLGEATRANIPDSNYSTKRITKPRYEGSRSTSNDFNLSSNEGGLGTLPNVEQDRAYFAYFNWVGGTTPEWGNGLEDRSALSIRYFVDSEGNVIEPTNDSNNVNLSITRQTFTEGETGVLSFDDENGISSQFQNLVGEQTIFKSGKSITPIAYSQTQSISDTTPGGFTGSLTFVQGDQAESILGDYRSTAYSIPQFITDTNVPFTVLFPSQQYLGDEGSFTLGSIYSSSIDASPDVTLKFEAYIEAGITTQNGSSAVFHIQKNSSGAGWVNVSSGVNVLEPGVRNSITITYTDPNSTANDDYRVRVTSANINTGTGPAGYIDINSTSYFKITQTPPPSIGDVGPSGSLAQSRYWQKVGGAPTKIKPNALMAVYGQKQKDIIEDINGDSVGFSAITNDFILQVGDEIRFQGTETQTYKIIEIDNTPANGDPLHLILDKEVNLTNVEMDWFLVRRYVDTPGQIIIEADKPAGGTSPGFFMPLYATKGIEDNFDKVIQQLKTDQLI